MRPSPERLRDYREFPVLYVDDEEDNRRIFELAFRREFSILTAESGEEGLEILNQQPVALVLSDHKMPGMMGTEFLARVAEIDPRTIRIMVTAYGDADTLRDAINNGSIYRFVPKPWEPEDVRATLRRGIDAYANECEREQLLRELSFLSRISSSLAQELDLDRLLDLLLATLVEEMAYDAAGLLFFGDDETLRFDRLAPGDGAADRALREIAIAPREARDFMTVLRDGRSQTLQLAEALDYEAPIRDWATEVAAEEILVIPLHGKSGVIGALCVDNRRGGAAFGAADRTLLEGLSNQAVIAIENARLVEDLRHSQAEVQRAAPLGTSAARLAGEIHEPLTTIHDFLCQAPEKRDAQDPGFWEERHEQACREVERIQERVDTLRERAANAPQGGKLPRSSRS